MSRHRVEIDIDVDARDAVRDTDRARGSMQKLDRTIDDTRRTSGRAGGTMGNLAGGLATIGRTAAVGAGALVGAGAAAYKLSTFTSDLGEASSAAASTYGSAFGKIEAASKNSARTVGLSRTEYLNAAKDLGTMGRAGGLTGEALAGFSTGLITATADMASFHNADPTEVLAAINSGLRGEAEPLRRFGILMDDASLKSSAMKLGLIKTTNEALTPQQKVLAAQKLIMEQLGAAKGDFTRTSSSQANQERILTAQLKDQAAELGTALTPAVTALLTKTNEIIPKVASWATTISGQAQPAVGRLQTGISRLTQLLDPNAKAVDRNRVAEVGMKSASDNLVSGLRIAQNVVKIFTTAADNLGRVVGSIAKPALEGMQSGANSVKAALDRNPEIMRTVAKLTDRIAGAFKSAGKAAEPLAGAVGGALKTAFDSIGGAIGWVIDQVGAFIRGAERAIAIARQLTGTTAPKSLGSAKAAGDVTTGWAPVATAAGLATAAAGAEPLATGWLSSLPALIMPAAGPAVQIIVQGALDPMAVARQIIDLLNRHARYTGRVQLSGAVL